MNNKVKGESGAGAEGGCIRGKIQKYGEGAEGQRVKVVGDDD
jgi:hypothetical protein